MNNILKAATTLAVATASLGALATPSEARVGQIHGYRVDVAESGSWNAPDFITIHGPRGIEHLKVTCAPFSWNSYGPNTESFVGSIASSWCF